MDTLTEAISIIEELCYKHLGGCCPATYDEGMKCGYEMGSCPNESEDCWKTYLERRAQ